MNNQNEQSGTEDYVVLATVTTEKTVLSMPCKIYLPVRIHEKPKITLKPIDDSHVHAIMDSEKFTFRAEISDYYGKTQTIISAPKVNFFSVNTRIWPANLSEHVVYGEPQDLCVSHLIEAKNNLTMSEIIFWVSPSRLLSPFLGTKTSYTGSVAYTQADNMEFQLAEDTTVKFKRRFKSRQEKNKDLIQWSYLTATIKTNTKEIDNTLVKDRLLQSLDDLLLIASLASDYRIACLGWDICDQTKILNFYRGNYAFPQDLNDESPQNWIIPIEKAKIFVEFAYKGFNAYHNKLSLRSSIFAIVPPTQKTIESSFLNLFSSLESLVLDFRRNKNFEFIVPPKEWKKLRRHLEKSIGECSNPELNANQISSMQKKLNEINRFSIREAFEAFCDEYGIYVGDLWPVFSTKDTISLSQIRNRLAHGDQFNQESSQHLFIACQHLRYILIRAILRIIGWNISDSNVSPAYLKMNSTAAAKFTTAQMGFTNQ